MYNVYMWEGLLDVVVVVFIGEFGVTVVIVVVGIVTTVV